MASLGARFFRAGRQPIATPGALALCVVLLAAGALPAVAQSTTSVPARSTEQRVYAQLRPAVVTVRSVSAASGRSASYGSGFHVDSLGHVVTNYHVVADHLHQRAMLRLRAIDDGGRESAAEVLAFDVANDLALLKVERHSTTFIGVPGQAAVPTVGSWLYSLGNPLDLGVTVMAGHYSSRKSALGITRLHFSGTLNAGMSGGPVVDAAARLVGVNVSKSSRGEQVAFLVPADAVAALLARPRQAPIKSRDEVSAETARQVDAWERAMRERALGEPWLTQAMGPYAAPEILPRDLDCWARDTAEETPPSPVRLQGVDCRTFLEMRAGDDGITGRVIYRRAYLQTATLNRFQFARALDAVALRGLTTSGGAVMGPQQCLDRLVARGSAAPLRVIWCASPYRELPGLFDVAIALTTQDRPLEALALRLQLEGVRWDTGLAFARRLVESVQ